MQPLMISLLILLNVLTIQKNNQTLNPLIKYETNRNIINEDVETTVTPYEDPLIKGQLDPIPAGSQTFADLMMEISTIDEGLDEMEARSLKLLDLAGQFLATINEISESQEKKRDTESLPVQISYFEELKSSITKQGTHSTFVFWSCIFLFGALSFSLYLNVKLTKQDKAVARAKEEMPSVAVQTDVQMESVPPLLQHMMKALYDSGDSDDEDDLEDNSDAFSNQGTTKRKKKLFGFKVRKHFWNCLKLRNKKKKKSVALHHETSDESDENLDETSYETEESSGVLSSASNETEDETSETSGSDESITVPPRKKCAFNSLFCCKKCKSLESEDRESSKGKKKYKGLKLGKYFYRYKQVKRKRKEKKWLCPWCRHKPSNEEEESLDENDDESEESNDETTS